MIAYLPATDQWIALPYVERVERSAEAIVVFLASGDKKTLTRGEDRKEFMTLWQRYMLAQWGEV